VADAAFAFRDATADELAAQAAKSTASNDEWQNKPYELSDEELAALGLTVSLDSVLAVTPSNGVEQLMLVEPASNSAWVQDDEEQAGSTGDVHVNTVDPTQPLLDEILLNSARVM
jgi:hypothetical protein